MEIDPKKVPVMKKCCRTCPFKLNEKGLYQDMNLANEVIKRTLFQAHQILSQNGRRKQRTQPPLQRSV